MPLFAASATPTRPSAATRPAFFAAFAKPFLRSQSTATSILPSVSVNAALQSIMPAPVFSRSSFTICGVIFAIAIPLGGGSQSSEDVKPSSLCRELLGLGDPPLDPAGEPDSLADLVGVLRGDLGDLPEMEDAEIVEHLLDGRRYARELLEVVGDPARTGQRLETVADRLRRHLLEDRLLGRAEIGAKLALRARDAVDRRLGDEIAIERDRPRRIVVAGHRKVDAIRIAIGVDHRDDRNAEAVRFVDRDVLLIGVDHEHEIGKAAHVPDAAERPIELLLLAGEREPLLLGVDLGLAGAEHLVELAQPMNRTRDRLPVRQRAAEPAGVDVILRRALGRIGDRILRLAFGPDEQNAPAAGDRFADRLQGAVKHRHRLGEVDDVDIVAGPEDELRHLRVPAVGLMAEMHASFQQLAHRIIGKRHSILRFEPPQTRKFLPDLGSAGTTGMAKGLGPRVGWARL